MTTREAEALVIKQRGTITAVRRGSCWYRVTRDGARYMAGAYGGGRLYGSLNYVCSEGAIVWCCQRSALGDECDCRGEETER